MPDRSEQYGEQEYLYYYLLSQLLDKSDTKISKTQFWKLVCVTDRYLEEKGEDAPISRYWYQFGEMPLNDGLNLDFVKYSGIPNEDIAVVTLSKTLSDRDFAISTDSRRAIAQAVQWLTGKFSENNAEEIKDYHYENHAPKEFISNFDKFRDQLMKASSNQTTLTPSFNQKELQSLLDEVLLSYPDLYAKMKRPFLRWEDTTSLLLEQGEIETAQDGMEDFYQTLSRVELRIHHNKEIPESKLKSWKEQQDQITDEYRFRLEELRNESLRDYQLEGVLEEIAEPYSERMRESFRGERE